MTERRPVPAPTPPAADTPAWDIPGVAAALGTPIVARTDAVLGRGVAFRLGAPPSVDLELYEQARTVRMTGGDLQLALFDQDGPTIAPQGIVFASPHRTADLARGCLKGVGSIGGRAKRCVDKLTRS